MKNILTKASYMAFGSLLTLIGYYFGNIDNNSVNAQQPSEKVGNVVDKIRVRQLEIVGNDNSPRIYFGTDLDRGQIKFVSDNDTPQISLKTTDLGGKIEIYNKTGIPEVELGFITRDNNAHIRVNGPNKKGGVVIGTADDSSGIVIVTSAQEESKGMVVLQILKNHAGVVSAHGTSGGKIYLLAQEGGGIVQVERQNKIAALLSTNSNGGVLKLYKSGGKPLVRAGVTDKGEGFFATFNNDGVMTGSKDLSNTSTYTIEKQTRKRTSITPQ